MKQLYNAVITDKAESNVTKTQVFYYLNNVLRIVIGLIFLLLKIERLS